MFPVPQGVAIAGCMNRCTCAGTKDLRLCVWGWFVDEVGAVNHQRMRRGEGDSLGRLQARSQGLLVVSVVMQAPVASGEEASLAVEEGVDVERL